MKQQPPIRPVSVSVVICAHTLDRWEEIVRAVASVRAQTPPAHEILLVVDGNEALRERARREIAGAATERGGTGRIGIGRVGVMANAREPGLSGARMTGVDAATGEVIAFLDDDAEAAPGWVEALRNAYLDPMALGAGGPVEPLWLAPRPVWFPPEFDWVVGCTYAGMDVRGGRIRNPIGANMSIRADVIARAGGFSPRLGRRKLGFSVSGKAGIGGKAESCEETELCVRAAKLHPGGYFAYREGARVRHCVPASRTRWKYFVRRCLVEGAAKAALTALAGRDGLGAENRYVREILPRAFLRALAAGAPRRAFAIAAGLSLTAFAYARVVLRDAAVGADGASSSAQPEESSSIATTKGIPE